MVSRVGGPQKERADLNNYAYAVESRRASSLTPPAPDELEVGTLRKQNEFLRRQLDQAFSQLSKTGPAVAAAGGTQAATVGMATAREQAKFLRKQLAKAFEQLKAYQVKLPTLNPEEVETPLVDDVPPWVYNSKYMNPLLVAYEERIRELEEQIRSYDDELAGVHGHVEKLVTQNRELQDQLKSKMMALTQQAQTGNPSTKEELRDLEERVRILSEQNTLMREQEALWRKEKSRLVETAKQAAQLQVAYDQLQTDQTGLSQRAERLHEELDTVEQTRDMYKSKWSDEAGEARKLKNEFEALRTRHEEMRRELDAERDRGRIDGLNSALQASQTKERALARKVEAMQRGQQELSDSLARMEDLHNDLCEHNELGQLRQTAKKLRQDTESLKVENSKLKSSLDSCRSEIQRLRTKAEGDHKELALAHKEKSTSLTEKFKVQEKKLHDEIRSLEASNQKLQVSEARALSVAQALEKENEIVRNTSGQAVGHTLDQLNKAIATQKELLLQKNNSLEKAERLKADMERLKGDWEKDTTARDVADAAKRTRNEQRDLELLEAKERILVLESTLAKTTEKAEVGAAELDEVSHRLARLKRDAEQKYKEDTNRLKSALSESRAMHAEAEHKAKALIEEQASLTATWRDENRHAVLEFQQCANQLREENKLLRQRCKDAQNQVQNVAGQKEEAMRFVQQSQSIDATKNAQIEASTKKLRRLTERTSGQDLEIAALQKQNHRLRTQIEELMISNKRRNRAASGLNSTGGLISMSSRSLHAKRLHTPK